MARIIGNISLLLAGFVYLVPVQMLLAETRRYKDHSGGAVWGGIFAFGPLFLLLALALLMAVQQGSLAWVRIPRGAQYSLAFVAAISLAALTFFSYLAKLEAPSQLPWVIRPFRGWALHVVPLITISFLAFALNPQLASKVSPRFYQLPFGLTGAVSLIVLVVMLGEGFVASQKRKFAAIRRYAEEGSSRDRQILKEVEAMTPASDFAGLLGFANRYEKEEIRGLAISKAQSHPQFLDAIIQVLQSWRAESALVYLDACDVPFADKKKLALPINTAIEEITKQTLDAVDRTHTFYAGQFDWNTRLILSVAEKFDGQGVDYVPAIRAYRQAMESERTRDVQLNARGQLDKWLARRK
jgi:hypothetical protein